MHLHKSQLMPGTQLRYIGCIATSFLLLTDLDKGRKMKLCREFKILNALQPIATIVTDFCVN